MRATIYPYGSIGFELKKLPMSARMKARRNTINHYKSSGYLSTGTQVMMSKSHGWGRKAILACFVLDESPEGIDYWENIISKYDR